MNNQLETKTMLGLQLIVICYSYNDIVIYFIGLIINLLYIKNGSFGANVKVLDKGYEGYIKS